METHWVEGDNGAPHETAELAILGTYVPEWLFSRALLDPGVLRPEAGVRLQAAVASAHIAGFTALAERLTAIGPEGADELTALLNQIYTALLDAAATQGGSVVHFGGDALTVLFPAGGVPPHAHRRGNAGLLAPAVLRAVRGAVAMQAALAPFHTVTTRAGVVELTMVVGISAGGLLAGVVGRPEIGLEFGIAGRTLDCAANAERHAGPGTIQLDTELIAFVRDQVTLGLGATTSRPVLAVKPAPPAPRRLRVDGVLLPDAENEALLAALRPFLPPGASSPWPRSPSTQRRVTTAFIRFSGLDYDYDPQPLHKLQTYFTLVQEAIAPFGGRIHRLLGGDKGSMLHLLFGGPLAQEDAARALRAARAILADCPLPFPGEYALGVATGPAFAGVLGSATRREYTLLGEVVQRAARLAEIALPGQILVDAATAERSGPPFRLRALPPRALPGLREEIPLWSLEGDDPRAPAPALGLIAGEERAPLVGRDAELHQVAAIAQQVQEGHGQVLLISGEAGIGKTRLIEALLRRWLAGGGLVYAGTTPVSDAQGLYRPWIELLNSFCDLTPGLSPDQQWARLTARVTDLAPALTQDLPLLAQLLGVAAVETPALVPGQADPPPVAAETTEDQFRSRRRMELILELLRAEARRRPLLLLLDGLHWADPASLALVNAVAGATLHLPILLCLEARPGQVRDLPALTQPNAHVLILHELTGAARAELLDTLAAQRGCTLSPVLAAMIQQRSQGNPFFMEELLAALDTGPAPAAPDAVAERRELEFAGDHQSREPASAGRPPTGELRSDPRSADRRPAGRRSTNELHLPPAFQVPDSIEGVLAARLDSLDDPAREVVRIVAVLGAGAPLTILRGLVPDPLGGADLQGILAGLVQADLLRVDGAAPDILYRFKHSLTRQVAYESLIYAQRRQLHGQAGVLLEELYGPDLSEHYDTLAYHYGLSDRYEQGRIYLEKAGDRAAGLFVLGQAVQYYEQALAPGRWPELQQEVAADTVAPLLLQQTVLYRKLARAQVRTGDYTGAEAGLRQALAICPAPAWDVRIVLYCELAWMYETQGNYAAALAVCRDAQAALVGRPPGLLAAQVQVRTGSVLFRQGDYTAALAALQAALPVLATQPAQPELAVAHNILGNISLMRADLAGARAEYEQSLGLYQAQDDLWGMAACYNNLGNVCWGAGQLAAARDYYEQSLALREQMGDPGGAAMVYTGLAAVYWQMGDMPEAHRAAHMAIVLAEQVGRVECVILAYIEQANLLETEGDFSAAFAQYSHAHLLAQQIGSTYLLGRTGLGRAQLHLRLGDRAAARAQLDTWAPHSGAQAELLQHWMFINAELALETGQAETAATILGELAALAKQYGGLYVWCATARLQGELALAQQDLAGAAAYASRARALAEQMPARVELARALDLLARCYAADPTLPGAVTPDALVAQAISILEQCGPTRYLTPLRLRLAASSWPDAAPVDDPVDGIPPATAWQEPQWDEVEDYDF